MIKVKGMIKISKLLLIISLTFCVGINNKQRITELEHKVNALTKDITTIKKLKKADVVLSIMLASLMGVSALMIYCERRDNRCDWRRWHRDNNKTP